MNELPDLFGRNNAALFGSANAPPDGGSRLRVDFHGWLSQNKGISDSCVRHDLIVGEFRGRCNGKRPEGPERNARQEYVIQAGDKARYRLS